MCRIGAGGVVTVAAFVTLVFAAAGPAGAGSAADASRDPGAAGRESRLYKHPGLDFQFRAPEGWLDQARPEDGLIYEVADPQTNIHVVLWYTTTEQDGLGYLKKMADMKGLIAEREPEERRIDGLTAWVLGAPGTLAGAPIHALLAVIPCGMSPVYPAENALYIVEIRCAEENFETHFRAMEEILDSVHVMTRVSYRGEDWPLYPEPLGDRPELPSPLTTEDGREFVVAHTKGGGFALLPVTVENGAPLDYARNQWNKGRQLGVDAADFPALAQNGLHSEAELKRTTTITGRPVADITADGRPGASSISGFLARDEDIVSVLKGDNRLVSELGLTHRQLARPLFQVFNTTLRNLETYRRGQSPWNDIEYLLYDGRRVFVDSHGSKGWQESIFADEVLGYFELRMRRELGPEEERYLREAYAHLEEAQLSDLMEGLSSLYTGEMVPFYVMRYGFYEGHTDYRADPIGIASVFGLMSIPEIDAALRGDLYERLTVHYTAESAGD